MNNQMNLTIENGALFNEDGKMIAVFADATQEEQLMLIAGPEAVENVKAFVDEVNRGKFKPKTAFKRFENFLEKHKLAI